MERLGLKVPDYHKIREPHHHGRKEKKGITCYQTNHNYLSLSLSSLSCTCQPVFSYRNPLITIHGAIDPTSSFQSYFLKAPNHIFHQSPDNPTLSLSLLFLSYPYPSIFYTAISLKLISSSLEWPPFGFIQRSSWLSWPHRCFLYLLRLIPKPPLLLLRHHS